MRGTLVLSLVLLLVLFVGIDAQAARKENVKYLKCPVCEEVSNQLYSQVMEKQAKLSPKKKLSEIEIIELAERICDGKKKESDWIFFLDIVREGNRLKLVEQPEEGECNVKCKTIQRTCQEVIGNHDTDIGEFISTHIDSLSPETISKVLCKDLTKSCSSKPLSLPKELYLGEPFTPKPSKDADMARLMRSMGDMPGAPGMKMYSKEDLKDMRNFGREDDEDEDEDEEENQFQSLLSKKPNNVKAANSKKSLTEIISSVTKQVSESVNDVSRAAVSNARRLFRRTSKLIRRWLRKRSKRNQSQSQRAEL